MKKCYRNKYSYKLTCKFVKRCRYVCIYRPSKYVRKIYRQRKYRKGYGYGDESEDVEDEDDNVNEDEEEDVEDEESDSENGLS